MKPVLSTALAATFVLVPVLVGSPAAASAQDAPRDARDTPDAPDALAARYDTAYFAWEEGDYIHALETLDRLIEADDEGRFHEPVALLTGELYRTVEVAPDGTDPRWSPDGAWAAYETETEDDDRVTHVVRVDDDGGVTARAAVNGHGLVFDPSGERAAYLALPSDDAYRAARDSVEESFEVTDFQSYQAMQRALSRFDAERARLVVRDLDDGAERELRPRGLSAKHELAYGPDGTLYVVGNEPGDGADVTDVYATGPGADDAAERVTDGGGLASDPVPVAGGRHLVHALGGDGFAVVDLADGSARRFEGESPAVAANGSALAYVASGAALEALAADRAGDPAAGDAADQDDADGDNAIVVLPLDAASVDALEPAIVARTDDAVANPAVSPDGRRVVYQRMPREDWELFAVGLGGAVRDLGGAAGDGSSADMRVTRDIQHDLYPQFVDADRVLAVVGEGRHRRSFVYDLAAFEEARSAQVAFGESGVAGGRLADGGTAAAARLASTDAARARTSSTAPPVHPTAGVRVQTRLFHNNTVRTFSPEYEWAVSPDGSGVLVVAERDGNTISPESGVYRVDLTRIVTRDELRDRVGTMLRGERMLRARGERAFSPVADAVRSALDDVSVARIYEYERELASYGPKWIAAPGNRRAIAYLTRMLESFGYDVELEWFEPRGERTANVVATLPGATNPDLVYVISSHFDSVNRGVGADDNTSGTVALLETARVLTERPQAATIQFAFFTGEEAGLLGSREYVRRAVESGKRIVGALNNDMVGYANDHRLDNTIRYSNDGIRDLQHAAAFLFTDLITYDARYYQSTDAHAYYDAYGDIVGGIGSYPVLSSPHYHQEHDVLEIVDHRLITEVAKTTVASIVRLASSPSRLDGLEVVSRDGDAVELRWNAAPENDVERYIVAWGPEDPEPRRTVETTEPRVRLQGIEPGTEVRIKAVNARGLDGWDWARVRIEE